MPEASAAAIIVKQIDEVEHVLLTLRDHQPFDNFWCIPGGHIEKNESVIDAINREIKEETELNFSGEFFGYFEEYIPELDHNYIVLVFYGTATGSLPDRTEEVSDFKWLPLSEAVQLKLAFRHQEILDAYYQKTKYNETEKKRN